MPAFISFSLLAQKKDFVLVEAESFNEKGGWVLDQQFMDQMGSPFLLAHGLGKPGARCFNGSNDSEKRDLACICSYLELVFSLEGERGPR